MLKVNQKKGSGLVEILVAVSIFSVILVSLITVSNMYLSSAGESLKSAKGAYLAQEGMEAVKIIRDTNWNNISAITDDVNFYIDFDTSSSTNNTWKSTSTFSYIDSIYIRVFKLNSVFRDSNGRIIQNGGTLDPNSKKVTVTVSWKTKNSTITKILSTYITNII